MSDDKNDPKAPSSDDKVKPSQSTSTRATPKQSKQVVKTPTVVKNQASTTKDESKPKEEPAINTDTKPADNKPADAKPIDSTTISSDKDAGQIFNAKSMPRMDTKKRSGKRSWLPAIAIILALITIGFVAWSGYQQHLMQQDWQQLEADIDSQIKQQSATNLTSSQTAESGLKTASDNQRVIMQQTQLIQQLRQALTVTQERIRELSGRRNQDWMLAEAEYLIKLAEYKITLEKDKQSAIALLKTADEKVLAIGDNSLIELRQAIAQDTANLQLVVAPDISGISVNLDALGQQVPALSIIALEFAPLEAAAQSEITESDEFSWQGMYRNFLNDFVTIKDHSEPVKPLMTVEQRGNLDANILLALQQAQIAAVRGEQGLYETNLNNAINWIAEFFKQDQTAESLLENLNQLKLMRVNIDLPKALIAKQQIEAINQQRLYQWLESSNPASVETESQP